MDRGNIDIQSKFVNALRTQAKAEYPLSGALPCPFPGHHGRMFQSTDQLFDHAKTEHASELLKFSPEQARDEVRDAALKLRKTDSSIDATNGGGSTPDITSLTLSTAKERQSSPYSGRKRPAESEGHGRREKAAAYVDIADSDYDRNIPHKVMPEQNRRSDAPRLFDPNQASTNTSSPQRSIVEPSGDRSRQGIKISPGQPQSPSRPLTHRSTPKGHRQPGLIDLQRYDPRFPGLLLQPDSRPISQEQLASEVKSIYAGLTMVETKCISVDRAQATAALENTDPNHKLASDHWQALIALHRTLLHEHHDFFLASQHPSASQALRRLAGKYSMPARMWKHGIHSFLELLRRRLPESIDYMLAFIYLAYQMMALLYETVPAFEDTWIECLGDLGRYRMAIEDEDVRDRETWAGVARSWCTFSDERTHSFFADISDLTPDTKAADKNPTVGRLYHHLAILARPNALQQLYYYSRSLTCVKPFPSARESILTLLDPILGRAVATYSHALPIDTNYIKTHGLLFDGKPSDELIPATTEFINSLDNHIGRVTAKWKEQGVYIAVTNVSGWFDYGVDDNVFRQVFLTELFEKAKTSPASHEQLRTASPADQQDPTPPSVPETELLSKVNTATEQPLFSHAKCLTNDTFALVLRRIGDKNVLPHVHIMLSFLTTFAANQYVAHLLSDTPWAELVAFLNTLVKTENQVQNQSQAQNTSHPQNIDTLFSSPVFPNDGERTDELPLPEDYLVRGLIWTHAYFPKKWFEREHDEEERYLELASTVKSRMERVLRLGHKLASYNKWIAYDEVSHTFSLTNHTSDKS